MIQKIGSVDLKQQYNPNWASQPKFTGLGEAMLSGVQLLEKYPMLNVSVLDLSTAIIPRTYIETKESNVFAGMEAFRRESSGLIVNCLLPSFIVMGMAKLFEKPIMGKFSKSNLARTWANEESLNVIEKYISKAQGVGKEKLSNAINAFLNDIEGIDGKTKKKFSQFNLSDSAKAIANSNDKKSLQKAYETIAKQTHMTEYLEIEGKVLSKDLKGYLEDFVNIGKSIIEKEGITDTKGIQNYIKKATKLVNAKSFAGLAIVLPLAISMQPLNRWLTSKRSGVKGAPIYKDYMDSTDNKELSSKEKKELFTQKLLSIGAMLGVAFLSMGCKIPNKQMLQFKGIFPTMDQARLISTATFASRMAASEDKNELREATIRDIATYSSLYFLGDYAAKAIATLIEKIKPDVKLLNKIKDAPKDANVLKKIKHWLTDVTLKSSDEVVGKTARNLRSLCHVGNLLFSLGVLGLFIPLYNRTQTNKKREQELKKLAESSGQTNNFLKDQMKNNNPAFKAFFQ